MGLQLIQSFHFNADSQIVRISAIVSGQTQVRWPSICIIVCLFGVLSLGKFIKPRGTPEAAKSKNEIVEMIGSVCMLGSRIRGGVGKGMELEIMRRKRMPTAWKM